MKIVAVSVIAGLLPFAVAAAQEPAPACPPGFTATTEAELSFGRNIGATLGVSRAEWRRFVDREVTPRFPLGFSVLDAAGQYKAADDRIVREPSKRLAVALDPADAGALERLKEIAEAYKRRFRQESVLTVLRPVCVAF